MEPQTRENTWAEPEMENMASINVNKPCVDDVARQGMDPMSAYALRMSGADAVVFSDILIIVARPKTQTNYRKEKEARWKI